MNRRAIKCIEYLHLIPLFGKKHYQSFYVGDGAYGVVEIPMPCGNSTNGQQASSTFTSNCG